MIRYHGTPITPEAAASQVLATRHGMVSFAYPEQMELVAETCASFVLDNGAFSAWKAWHKKAAGGRYEGIDVGAYRKWVSEWSRHPGYDWCIIPDVIDGTEAENREYVTRWGYDFAGVPVWHMHESFDWLEELVERFPRIALGSSGQYATIGTDDWWLRMCHAMDVCCFADGKPRTKLHGLRMMDPRIFSRIPFASVDSCNVARNIGYDSRWDHMYLRGLSLGTRACILAYRAEQHASASLWGGHVDARGDLLFGVSRLEICANGY